ncbi:serine protease inhibitor 42Dd [Drosophila subpulchrella]|uniref:serine protease inhibitor 42Dd n=1 Tax=Drosophila subpulchrella TaxID=1486046 RepID=UPI0018A162D4|nr:serine protease inhibitor 42Dd [Drosophila subpulchrella]
MIHWRLLCALFVGLAIALPFPVGGELPTKSAVQSNHRFGLRLTTKLGLSQPDANVVVSPLLVQAALSLLYARSSPDSGRELRQALELTHAISPKEAVQDIQSLLTDLKQLAAVGCRLRLLSDFYAQQRFTFNFLDEFEVLASRMGVGCHRLSWESASNAAQDINYSFLSRSNYSLGELVSSSQLESLAEHNTPFLHVSGLTFRAPWAQAFDPAETTSINFFAGGNRPRLVDAMFGQHRYRYAEMPALDAQLIEVPFATAGLKMLIVFPNRADGLAHLEKKLAQSDLQQLRGELQERKVALTLPKLRVLVHSALKPTLEELGLAKLFTSQIQLSEVFSSLLTSSAPPLGAVEQSGLLELQEEGGDAGDSFSFGDLFRRAVPLVINHPFFYAIGNDKTLLLAGHIVDI